MRWSAAAAVLLIVVVASLALNVYQYSSPRSVTTTTATMTVYPSSVCTTKISQSNATGMVQLYHVTPGIAAVLCVTYVFQAAGNYSFGEDFGPSLGTNFAA